MVEDIETPMTIYDDGEGFLTLLNSTSKGDTVQVDEDSADLYMVVHTSCTNLYFLVCVCVCVCVKHDHNSTHGPGFGVGFCSIHQYDDPYYV